MTEPPVLCPHCKRVYRDDDKPIVLTNEEANKTIEQLRLERDLWKSEFESICQNRIELIIRAFTAESKIKELCELLKEVRSCVEFSNDMDDESAQDYYVELLKRIDVELENRDATS